MEQAGSTTLWCPGCLAPVGGAAACPSCGLGQLGPEAARLRVVVHRLYELGEQRRALEAEAAALALEQRRLLDALAPEPVQARSRAEWRPAVVRGLLLGLGAVLVGLAALIFAVVAWVRLGDLGRAGLLAGATLVTAAAAAVARRRLPATAEALGGLALALLLVDCYAARRAGAAPGWTPTAWWAAGTACAAAVAAVAGRWLRLQRPAAATLAQVAAVLAVLTVAEAPWTVATGLALVAAAAATLATWLASGTGQRPGGGGRRDPGRGGWAAGPGWRPAGFVLGSGAALLELAALGLVLQAPAIDDLATASGPATALAAMALAPAAARATGASRGRLVKDLLVAASAGALLGATGTLLAAVWTSWALAAAVAVLGAAGIGGALVLPRSLRAGSALAATGALAGGLVGVAGPVSWVLVAPSGWLVDPWSARADDPAYAAVQGLPGLEGAPEWGWPAVVALLACAAAAVLAATAGRTALPLLARQLAATVATAAAAGAVAVVPLAAGWPLWATQAVTATAALAAGAAVLVLERRDPPAEPAGPPAEGRDRAPEPADPPAEGGDRAAEPAEPLAEGRSRPAVLGPVAGVGLGLLGIALGWALATEPGTLTLLGVLVVAGVAGTAAAAWSRRGWGGVAAAAAIGEVGAVTVHLGGGAAEAGVAATVAAGAVLVAASLWRRGRDEGPVAEWLGLAGMAVGIALAAVDERLLAAALTAATPALLLASLRPARRGYLALGAAAAVAATWAWLAAADVTLPEAYTLPAAAITFLAGLAARHRRVQLGSRLRLGLAAGPGRPRPGSWLAYGPGLALALLPSLGLAVDGRGLARPLLVSAGALLVVLAGARTRLQAPLVLGAVTLVVLGVDAALPVAARLPRWVSIGGTGLLLLWLGATAERRVARLRELRERFQELEPGGAAPGAG